MSVNNIDWSTIREAMIETFVPKEELRKYNAAFGHHNQEKASSWPFFSEQQKRYKQKGRMRKRLPHYVLYKCHGNALMSQNPDTVQRVQDNALRLVLKDKDYLLQIPGELRSRLVGSDQPNAKVQMSVCNHKKDPEIRLKIALNEAGPWTKQKSNFLIEKKFLFSEEDLSSFSSLSSSSSSQQPISQNVAKKRSFKRLSSARTKEELESIRKQVNQKSEEQGKKIFGKKYKAWMGVNKFLNSRQRLNVFEQKALQKDRYIMTRKYTDGGKMLKKESIILGLWDLQDLISRNEIDPGRDSVLTVELFSQEEPLFLRVSQQFRSLFKEADESNKPNAAILFTVPTYNSKKRKKKGSTEVMVTVIALEKIDRSLPLFVDPMILRVPSPKSEIIEEPHTAGKSEKRVKITEEESSKREKSDFLVSKSALSLALPDQFESWSQAPDSFEKGGILPPLPPYLPIPLNLPGEMGSQGASASSSSSHRDPNDLTLKENEEEFVPLE